MIGSLKWLLKSQRKRSGLAQVVGGFTLIELLVAILLAALVVTPLLTFMSNILDTDNKEQAKATSEQEIQSALDFIAQDLEQAVYIYDADGLNNNSTDTTPGIKNQIPPLAEAPGCQSSTPTCVPVLVFWKRELRQNVLPVTNSTARDDTFVYSLVAYYLIKGNTTPPTWSNAARIGRFQIRNGVRHPTTPNNSDGTPNYIEEPSEGFQLFNLNIIGNTLKDKMNRWQKTNVNYTDRTLPLVDFIDQDNITPTCPANTPPLQLVPSSTVPGGFYACVDSSKTSAQVYIRGSALARIKNNPTNATCVNQPTFCPTANILIKGRGLLGVD